MNISDSIIFPSVVKASAPRPVATNTINLDAPADIVRVVR